MLRDDAVGSVGYPMSVPLADGTIFTACELGKPAGAPEAAGPEEQARGRTEAPRQHARVGQAQEIDMVSWPHG